ncbi:hypothetical protein [Xanthomonas sp. LMG 12462]|uniref:hypothetical protein n=1 Tax=Xanthomonas sp. LMG 12462 TaxID=1591134 RepID=UPI00126598C9|nr:hypothetical protein [Xanthomonas sp. LMG 12462]KAB7764761.1 hypothetical protein CEK69_18270 [Xanthomonas sp. LMG 12462]
MTFQIDRCRILALSCVASLAFIGGCKSHDATDGDTGEDASSSVSGVKSLPALHVVLTWESLLGGENLQRKNYQAKLDACRGSGMPTRALSPQEEAKLGTGEIEIMIDAHRQFAHQVSWTLGADGDSGQTACLIKLEEHTDKDTVEDADGMYMAIDSSTRAQDRQTFQAAGWTLTGEGQVKGQPCTRWQNGKQEVCMWSAGSKWGFSESPADAAGCTIDAVGVYLQAIPLEAKPLRGGNGCVLQVKSFSLGSGLIPSNVAGGKEEN